MSHEMQLRRVVEIRFLRFIFVGVLNTAFSYAVYAVLLYAGLHFALANLGALLLGILFSFKTQGALVFRNRDNRLLGRFVLFWAMLYGMNIGVITVAMSLGLNDYWAGLVALPIIVPVSYLLQGAFVFGSARPSRPRASREE